LADAFLEPHTASTSYAWYGRYQSDGNLLRITLAPTCCRDSDQADRAVPLAALARRADLELARSATDRLDARRGVIIGDAGGVDLGDVRF
jgi:hypothetical protein